ncbi:hypothetical protein FRC16_002934 [Serendipita sp. 398]|nr:hypothetical protein FRC16_002934 [Serendipita sp. 398]
MMEVSSPPIQGGFTNGHASPNVNGHDHVDSGGIDGVVASNSATESLPFDTSVFRNYLQALLPPVLGATPPELEDSIFSDPEFEERVKQFATQPGGPLYVAKIQEDLEADQTSPPTYRYALTSGLTYSPANVATLALIKRVPSLDSTLPIATQIQMLNLFGDEDTPYESLHAVVSQAVKPWFDAFVGTRPGIRDSDSKIGIPNAKKKFAELELSLFHLQQNVEIPETHLVIHPVIQRAVDAARESSTRINVSIIPSTYLNDSSFLNALQSHVNSWIKAIQGVTKLSRDVSAGTASQEINFWLSLERALDAIDTQLHSEEVVLVLECLRHARRYLATVSFASDTGLKEGMETVKRYNGLMKDFPLDELLSATDLEKIQDSLGLIFGHLNGRLRRVPYPIRRALPLVEAISRDFNDTLLRVLTSHRLIYQPYETFERLVNTAINVFKAWDDYIKDFTNVAREVTRKRSEKFIPIKINPAHAKLAERVRYLRDWRRQHEQLAVTTAPTKGLSAGVAGAAGVIGAGVGNELGGVDMEEEVKEAYEIIKNIDILDVSIEGTEIWVTAENAYNERIARVENQIIARLRDRLGTARNANEMFRVFSKFNALFVRPKIRGAIQEYQTQLIESVKEDIKHLHTKFKTQYRYSEAYHMSQMRDLPPIAGAIIWARQIERQLSTYMKRVEDVLGKGWELYADGQKLQTESSAFRKKLDTRPVYEAWLHEINRRDMAINGRLFEIVKLRGGGYQLAVNFDPQIITLFKEVRNLLWLGFQVPHAINTMAKEAKRVYPHAVSLMETVRTYGQTLHLIEQNQVVEMLVAEYRNEAQAMTTRGMSLRWDYFVNAYDTHRYLPAAGLDGRENRHISFVREFASVVSILQDKTNSLVNSYKEINRVVEDLSTCPYNHDAFAELIGKIQAAVDRLNLEGFANLENWVAELDDRIAGILAQRLTHILQVWCTEFDKSDDGEIRREAVPRDMTNKRKGDKWKEEKDKHTPDSNMTLEPIVHEIRIQNQVIFLDPPIEYARDTWIKQLHEWLGVICRLRRIRSSRYEIGLQMDEGSTIDLTYTFLLTRFTDGTLEKSFTLIENKVQQLRDYVSKWLQFQSLWDLEAEYVFNRNRWAFV